MKVGLVLDNNPIGTLPAESSFSKLIASRSSAVMTMWTGGTHHTMPVYHRCEEILGEPFYITRVGGHYQTPDEWRSDAYVAWGQIPLSVRPRVVFTFGNEPNLEGWQHDPEGYGKAYAVICNRTPLPVLFACPSLGVDGWAEWLAKAMAAAGQVRRAIINLYAGNVGRIGDFVGMFDELYVGEVNSSPWVRGAERVEFLAGAFSVLDRARVKIALVFIGGGESHGSWDEGYIISDDEARAIGNIELSSNSQTNEREGETSMTFQFTLGFKDFAEGTPGCGQPVEDLQYDDHGNAWQHSTTGLLFWHKAGGEIYFFARPLA